MSETRLTLASPEPFDFAGTAYSHGWVVLAPNAWDAARREIRRVHRLEVGRVVHLTISGTPGPAVEVLVHHGSPLNRTEREAIGRDVTRMLRLDEDLTGFYALCRERGGRWGDVCGGLGRLLRSPTAFEDVVKTICTTNVQWGGTKRMVRELVAAYGEPLPEAARAPLPGPGGGPPDPDRKPGESAGGSDDAGASRSFPTPEAIAGASPEAFAAAVGLGYRAPYVHALARRVATGELDLEGLWRSELPTPELEKALRAIKGVGPYAAATLLMLIGRYDALAVDSVFREFVRRRHFDGGLPTDAELRAVYDGWGEWRYLAYWFDLWQGLEEAL